jgi:hypothetical protein
MNHHAAPSLTKRHTRLATGLKSFAGINPSGCSRPRVRGLRRLRQTLPLLQKTALLEPVLASELNENKQLLKHLPLGLSS